MRYTRAIAVGLCCVVCITPLVGGCAATPTYRRETYVVRPQDTLYSIAWRHDVDFHDLAKWNNIGPDYRLSVGQVLLLQPEGGHNGRHAVAGPGAAASRAAGAQPEGAAGTGPSTGGPASGAAPSALSQPPTASRPQSIPRGGKPKALNDAQGVGAQGVLPAGGAAGTGIAVNGARPGAGTSSGSGVGSNVPARASARAGAAVAAGGAARWLWPTDHSQPPRPVPGGGILLFGKLGQDVRAADAGRVVYTGSGIRGYGNLIIVKHGDNMLSSYAHNSEMLVHEGQDVSAGQVIAHMGTAAHQTSALYFEIRLNGKPVDPLRYLPGAK